MVLAPLHEVDKQHYAQRRHAPADGCTGSAAVTRRCSAYLLAGRADLTGTYEPAVGEHEEQLLCRPGDLAVDVVGDHPDVQELVDHRTLRLSAGVDGGAKPVER